MASEDTGLSPLILEQAERISEVLSFMKNKGFTFTEFIMAFLDNPTPRIRRHTIRFSGKLGGFMEVINKVLSMSGFARGARDTGAQAIQDFQNGIGEGLIEWLIKILTLEAATLCKDSKSRLAPRDLTPEHGTHFDIKELQLHYKCIAPVLYRIVSAMCLVSEEEVDECDNLEFEDSTLDPTLNTESEDPTTEFVNGAGSLTKKEIITTTVISQMIFSRTSRANALQTIIGYYLAVTNTSKNTITVLNYMGISISYSSIIKATAACAKASMKALKDEVVAGAAIGAFWDNMTMLQRVGEETTTNRTEFLNWTARGAWKLLPAAVCPTE